MSSIEETPPKEALNLDRRAASDRRHGDRRKKDIPVALERRAGSERRHGERRRQVDPTTCERDYTQDEIDFMTAMDFYKRVNRRPFPTWSEVLEVLISLGYRKTEARGAMPGLQPKMPMEAIT